MAAIDLNSDLGESFGAWTLGDDEAMLDEVTSANVACGFHAGDPVVMLATCRAAADRRVAVGAHPGYRDLAGFGRRELAVDAATLFAETLHQVGALQAAASAVGARVGYVKPHGALYHRVARDARAAEAVARAAAAAGAPVLVGLPGGASAAAAAEAGVRHVVEGFADRGYLSDGSLLPRSEAGAVLTDPDEVAERAVALACGRAFPAADGGSVTVRVDTLCLHGDTPGSVALARAVRAALAQAGVEVRPFVDVGDPRSLAEPSSRGSTP